MTNQPKKFCKHFSNQYLEPRIRAKIKANFGLGRIFRYCKAQLPIFGESILSAQILQVSKTTNRRFPERTIRRVINQDFDEKLEASAKRWMFDIAK